MASVAAILFSTSSPRPDRVEAMLRAAPHRGDRHQVTTLGDAVLGASCAADDGSVSLATADGMAAVFTGVLDNAADLGRAVDAGPPSPTAADVLLAGFRRHGDAFAARLRGDFAAVLTDGRRAWALRDHVGFGTLFYRRDARGTYLATEAKQVVAGAGIPPEPDLEVLERIFFGTEDDDMPCALRGVERLPKATVLEVDPAGVHRRRYWWPEALLETARFSADELADRFHHLMAQAVDRCLSGRGDVVSLSGGIDSPGVAAYAAPRHRELTGQPLPGLAVVYPDHPSVDERPYIEIVARRLGMALHTYKTKVRPSDDLTHWLRLVDGPVPDLSLPSCEEHYRRAAALGCRTLLTGELAEYVIDLRSFLVPHLLLHGRWSALGRELRSRRAGGLPSLWLARQLATALLPTPVTALRWRLRRAGIPAWVDVRRANEAAVRSIVPPRRRWRTVQLSALEGPGISLEADTICQAVCGVRVRKPWADIDLWELFLSLPAEAKFPAFERKALVRRLLRGRVPDEILDRRDKTYFDDWAMDSVDYGDLRRWLLGPDHRLAGVDYESLAERLERETLTLEDLRWARLLASIHAYLSLW